MCFHARLLYSGCNHSVFLEASRLCPTEKAFDRGEVDTGCSQMWSHGFNTVKVDGNCAKCTATACKTNYKLSVIKEQLKFLSGQLQGISKRAKSKSSSSSDGTATDGDESGSEDASGPGTKLSSSSSSANTTRTIWSEEKKTKTELVDTAIEFGPNGCDGGDDEGKKKKKKIEDGDEKMMEVSYHDPMHRPLRLLAPELLD